jgi:hypothetical protein
MICDEHDWRKTTTDCPWCRIEELEGAMKTISALPSRPSTAAGYSAIVAVNIARRALEDDDEC